MKAVNEKNLIKFINSIIKTDYIYCKLELIFCSEPATVYIRSSFKQNTALNALANTLFQSNILFNINGTRLLSQTIIFASVKFKYSYVNKTYVEKTKNMFISYDTNSNENIKETLKKLIKFKEMQSDDNYKLLTNIGIFGATRDHSTKKESYRKFNSFMKNIINLDSYFILTEDDEIFLNSDVNHDNVTIYIRNKLRTYINSLILSREYSYCTLTSTKLQLMVDAKKGIILECISLKKKTKKILIYKYFCHARIIFIFSI